MIRQIGSGYINRSLSFFHALNSSLWRSRFLCASSEGLRSQQSAPVVLSLSVLLKFLSVEPYLKRGWKQFRFGVQLLGDNRQQLHRTTSAIEEHQVEVETITMFRRQGSLVLVVGKEKSVSVSELSHAFHFYISMVIIGAVRQEIMTVSGTVPPILDLID